VFAVTYEHYPPCPSCKNRRFGGTLMMEALNSSETSVFIIATRRNIPEDAIIHSYRRENLKSHIRKYSSLCLVPSGPQVQQGDELINYV
jgi:hypothetical protein